MRLRRNDSQVNSMMALLSLALGANCDAQAVITVKGAADYICKYVTKYGAGQSVSSRIASILDDIILRVPRDETTTVASVMAKAFIATSVPDQVCSLEAWHLLWGLRRVVSSRVFQSLNLDGLRGVKLPSHMGAGRGGEGLEKDANMAKEMPWERYERRAEIPFSQGTIAKGGGEGVARERLLGCRLWEFVTAYEMRGGAASEARAATGFDPKAIFAFGHDEAHRRADGKDGAAGAKALGPRGGPVPNGGRGARGRR